MGGVWQALAYGFAGVRLNGSVATLDPHLPDAWGARAAAAFSPRHPRAPPAAHERLVIESAQPIRSRFPTASLPTGSHAVYDHDGFDGEE